MDRKEEIICQRLYWPDIIDAVQNDLTLVNIQNDQIKKYSKLPAKLAD